VRFAPRPVCGRGVFRKAKSPTARCGEEEGPIQRPRGLGEAVVRSHHCPSARRIALRRSASSVSRNSSASAHTSSTLELGIDVGDLDRVIQINAPSTVAAFLQRLGRTGRRPGGTRNCLFLALDRDSLVFAAGLLLLWGRGHVEPVQAPPAPRHIVAQQSHRGS
jgi:ATP-dependent helicase Lhr and Lhr-like helicase